MSAILNIEEESNYFFDIHNELEWMKYLDENGYCVIRAVASCDEVNTMKESLWNDLKLLFNADKNDPTTWQNIPVSMCGIFSDKSITQTTAPWLVRGLESVRYIFRTIWETDDLLVSMDSVIMWLPWWKGSYMGDVPVSEGLHIDQNPFFKPHKICVQGMMPLIDVIDEVGGLEVIPRSHLSETQEYFKSLHPRYGGNPSDWCVMNRDTMKISKKAILLKANAGDLILWDSRTIHGARIGTMRRSSSTSESTDGIDLARLAIPVCMTPKGLATQSVIESRRRGFLTGRTFTHWPHEARSTSFGSKDYTPIQLPPRVLELIPITANDENIVG